MSPVTLPSISEIKLERGKKLSFAAEFEETPEVSIKNYKGIKLKRVSTEVGDADVEKAFTELLDAYAQPASADGTQEKLVPVADDEFAKRFGKATLVELKEALRKELASHKQSESARFMRVELFQKLQQMAPFNPPVGVVERQRERLESQVRRQAERQGLKQEAIEIQIVRGREMTQEEAVRQVKLYFILNKISDLEEITADEIELEQRLEMLARDSKRPIDEVRSVFGEDLRESMREQKTVDFLIAHAQFDEK